MGTVSVLPFRVSYEETDAGGVVYYANYLRFFERGRTEWMRERGVSARDLAAEGIIFPVVRVELDYRSPAVYDDLLRVESEVTELRRASVVFRQRVLREPDSRLLCEGEVTLACVGPGMRPRRIPEQVARLCGP